MNTLTTVLRPLAVAVSLGLAGGALAQDVDNDFNVTVGAMKWMYDHDKNMQNETGITYGFEVPILDRWSVLLERYEVEDSHFKHKQDSAELSLNRLGINYHLNPLVGDVQPYLSLGFGDSEFDAVLGGEMEETTYDLGFGLKKDLHRNFLVKGDVKGFHGRQTSDWDWAFTLSLGFTFGGEPEARPVVREPEPEPQQQVVEADSDGDGVVDSRDRCPNTPRELAVDQNGCPILDSSMVRREIQVNFAFDSAMINPAYENDIADFAEFLEQYSNVDVTIEGHTDSVGTEEYNQGLSERRATAVRDALVNEHDIDADRVRTVGYGETRPIADNNTAEGREQNRRIEAEVSVEVQEERLRNQSAQ